MKLIIKVLSIFMVILSVFHISIYAEGNEEVSSIPEALLFNETTESGINVLAEYDTDTFDGEVSLVISDIVNDEFLSVSEYVLDNVENKEVKNIVGIDISFVSDGEEVEPKKEVQIKLIMPDSNLNDMYVVHNNDGLLEEMDFDVVNQQLEFVSDSFSPFYIIELVSVSGDNVASVNGVEYSTLNEAVENAVDGDTIELLKDIDGVNKIVNTALTADRAVVIDNKRITINGNGHKISWTNEFSGTLITVNANAGLDINNVVFSGGAEGWFADYANASSPSSYVNVPIVKEANDIEGTASMVVNSGLLNIKDSSFENIYTSKNISINGGAIKFLNGSKANMDNVLFKHIVVNMGSGGGIFVDNGAELVIQNSNFNENVASYGGAVYTFSGTQEIPVIIENTVFENCLAQMNGGVIYSSSSGMIITDSKFLNNKSGNDGAVLCFGQDGNAGTPLSSYVTKFNGVTFDNNKGLATGGQSMGSVFYLYNTYYGDGFEFNGCTITNNIGAVGAISDYGALNTPITINDSIFDGNKANSGAVFYLQRIQVVANNTKFLNNEAGSAGVGAVYYKSSLTLNNSLVQNNKATTSNGGAFRLFTNNANETPSLTVGASTEIKENFSAANGGGIYLYPQNGLSGSTSILKMEAGSKVYNNTAGAGGDDIAIGNSPNNNLILELVSAKDMNVNDINGNKITGWFWDRRNNRYQKNISGEYTELSYNGPLKTVYIKAANSDFEVIYDKNDSNATGVMNNQLVILDGEEVNLSLNQYSLANKIFMGWSDSANGSVVYNDEQSVLFNANPGDKIYLYAVWKDNIPVSTPMPSTKPADSTVRTCQDDGYSELYYWDDTKQACVIKYTAVPKTYSREDIIYYYLSGTLSCVVLFALNNKFFKQKNSFFLVNHKKY